MSRQVTVRGTLTKEPGTQQYGINTSQGHFDILLCGSQEHLQPGTDVEITGTLEQTRMTDADGTIHSTVRIVGDTITPV